MDQTQPDGAQPELKPNPLIGLALGSGLAHGFAHIGAIRALEKHGIRPGIVTGTSMGALVGSCYLAGKLDEFEDWALGLTRRKVFGYLDFKVRSAGLIGGNKLLAVLKEHFEGKKLEDLPCPFIAVGSDLVTGHEVWMRRGDFIDSIRASFALPGVFPPVTVNNRRLVDGALVNPVPVAPCVALGARITIAIDLNGDMIGKAAKPGANYRTIAGFDLDHAEPEDVGHENHGFLTGMIAKRLFHRDPDNPSLFGVMISALTIMQDRLTRSRLAGDPPDVHIKPRIGHIGLLEFERAKDLIVEGYEAVERKLPELQAAIEVILPRAAQEKESVRS
jgi:NTE family protein